MKAFITFPHYEPGEVDEVYEMEIPDSPCFEEPEPGLKYEAEIQRGFIRSNIKLLYNSIHPDRELCNVKFAYEVEPPTKEEVFELPDHLQDQRADWIIAERHRALSKYYKTGM